MSEVDKSYELKILKMIANKYLDESISMTEESLNTLLVNRDQIVWDLATKIYSQSGHKVELSIVRDIVNSRIEALKYDLAAEKKRREEQARRLAELEAQKAAEEARRLTEQKAHLRSEIENLLKEFEGDEIKAQVFVKVRNIISDELEVDVNKISLNSHLSKDLDPNVDIDDLMGLIMTLEEEFDIEIADNETEDEFDIYYRSGYSSSSNNSSGQSFWSVLGSLSAISSSSYSSYLNLGDKCIVKSFVDLIYKKLLEKK